MTATSPLPSGLPAVDREWGGLTPGGAYLLVGRAGAGRSALALQTVQAAVEDGSRCLVLSPRSPDALTEIGRGIGLDLAAAHAAGTLRLLRIPSAEDLAARGPDKLASSYHDLARLVATDRPSRVVVEDFTPLVQFDTFERFHHAFSELVQAFRAQGTTLVIGLGDPANDASRRLLDVVEELVDGTIHLDWNGEVVLDAPVRAGYSSNDGASVEAELTTPFVSESSSDTTPSDAAPADAGPSLQPEPVAGTPAESVPAEPEAPAGFQTTFSLSATPPASDAEPEAPSDADRAGAPQAAPVEASGPRETEIVAPPAPDPSLFQPDTDSFGHDPSNALFEQGFLADSGICPAAPPAPASAPPTSPPALPSFTPLGAEPAPPQTFRSVLDASFAARDQTPFVVVAVRAEPGTPAAESFGAIEAGLRASLRADDRLHVDAERARIAAVLPASGAEAGQALFDGLQAHLRTSLGDAAEHALQTLAAVTLANGQPFQTSAELMAYAVES